MWDPSRGDRLTRLDVVESYLLLGLRLGRHIDGFVDAYYGPGEPAAEVEAEQAVEPAALAADAEALAARLAADRALEASRRRWLAAQVDALRTVALRLAGEPIAFVDEVEACYGVRPRLVPEEEFAAAHEALDRVLPGSGALADRYRAWREGNSVPPDVLEPALGAVIADLRARTAARVGLPEGEELEVELVRDVPWAAFNYYLGGLRSRIAVSTDLPLPATFLGELVAHETYPGHHTERTWKESVLVRERGRLEETIVLIGVPQSLVAEGIASIGAEVLLGPGGGERVAAEHLRAVGVELDAELAHAVGEAREPLEHVGANAALLVHEHGVAVEEAREYIERWGLLSPQRAAKAVEFVTDPTWRAYASTYTDGRRLCRAFVGGDLERFRRLLTEQLLPRDLAA
jgi:hypothetical protein